MRQQTTIAIVLTVLGLAAPSTTRAWSCVSSTCPAYCTLPAGYYVGNIPASLDEAATLAAIQAGFDAWADPDCSSASATYLGRVTGTPSFDGMSVVHFYESGWPHPSATPGVTSPRWGADNCIEETDVELNAEGFTFSLTEPTASGGPTRNVMTEMLSTAGIFFGLGRSAVPGAVRQAPNADVTALHADDIEGICALYPAGGEYCPATPCASGEICVGRACVIDMCAGVTCGAGERCEAGACRPDTCVPCTTDGDCPGGSCLIYPDGRGYCALACGTDADCDPRETCFGTPGGTFCAQVDPSGMPNCGSPPPDAGGPDAGSDAGALSDGGPPPSMTGGCGCTVALDRPNDFALFALLALAVLRRRRQPR